jgi:SAM-dependent methyltransferase
MLSIGAGGEIDQHLRRKKLLPITVDIDPGRNPDLVADVETLAPLPDASMDIIFFHEVLEHVAAPQAAVDTLWRVLRPGGILVGSTPFLLGIHDAPSDYYRFTVYGLKHLFRRFECLRLTPRNGYLAATAVLVYRRFAVGTQGQKSLSLWLSPLLLCLGLFLEGLACILPADDGTTGYFFVFQKPHSATS